MVAKHVATPLAVFAAMVAAMVAASTNAVAGAPVLRGEWRSAMPEAQGKLFVTRYFRFNENRWVLLYRAYADPEGKLPLFTMNVGGVFVVGGASASVPDAYESVFPATRRSITADSAAGAALFAPVGCALKIGEPKALLSESCGFVPSLMSAMGEYDLVKISAGQLFFGDRAGDLTKNRPTALYAFPLIHQ